MADHESVTRWRIAWISDDGYGGDDEAKYATEEDAIAAASGMQDRANPWGFVYLVRREISYYSGEWPRCRSDVVWSGQKRDRQVHAWSVES